jgi:hypothetical protein
MAGSVTSTALKTIFETFDERGCLDQPHVPVMFAVYSTCHAVNDVKILAINEYRNNEVMSENFWTIPNQGLDLYAIHDNQSNNTNLYKDLTELSGQHYARVLLHKQPYVLLPSP